MFNSSIARLFVVLSLFLFAPTAQAAEPMLVQLQTNNSAPPASVGAFVDQFDGDELASHWDVFSPFADNFVVEDGVLLVVNSAFGSVEDDSLQNFFKLNTTPPEGDWTASIRVKLDAQTGEEQFFFLLHDDAQNYVGLSFYTAFSCGGWCAIADVGTVKKSGEQVSRFSRRVWTTEVRSNVFTEFARALPAFALRLEKRGRSFYPAIRLEGPGDTDWIQLERLVALRAKVHIAFALRQYEEVKGETIATIDWVRVEPNL